MRIFLCIIVRILQGAFLSNRHMFNLAVSFPLRSNSAGISTAESFVILCHRMSVARGWQTVSVSDFPPFQWVRCFICFLWMIPVKILLFERENIGT